MHKAVNQKAIGTSMIKVYHFGYYLRLCEKQAFTSAYLVEKTSK